MTFQEKIDKLLKVNKLGINTVYGLEAQIGAAPGAISKPLKKGDEPGPGTIKKIRDGVPGLNPDWWETGKGEVFITEVPQPGNNNGKNYTGDPEVYRTIVEGNTEYVLIPRTVLLDTKLISNEQLQNDRKVMDKLLDQNEKLIERVISLETQTTAVKKGQKGA